MGLPSRHAVGLSLEKLHVLLSPQPGGTLDSVLNNFTEGAHALDAQDSLKVETGGSGQVTGRGRADPIILTPRP